MAGPSREGGGGWEALSGWYDKKQGDEGDLWHRTLIDPVMLAKVGPCERKEVLDVGCGNGYLSRRLARRGALVTAVDSSPAMIKNAKAHDHGGARVRYVRAEANDLKGVPDSRFDLVFANMSLMDIADAEGAITEASRVLKPKGRFLASICHPCFDTMSNSGWVAEKLTNRPTVVSRKVRGYRKQFSEQVPWNVGGGRLQYTTGHHRPLGWYARVLNSKGLAITALEEPEPTKEFVEREQEKPGDLDGAGFQEVPLHLVIEAVKL